MVGKEGVGRGGKGSREVMGKGCSCTALFYIVNVAISNDNRSSVLSEMTIQQLKTENKYIISCVK